MMDRMSEMAPDNQNQPYALLTIEQHMLLLPQREVCTLESVLNIRTGNPPDDGVGWLSFGHHDWPVYGMDTALNPLSAVPASQRICALLTLGIRLTRDSWPDDRRDLKCWKARPQRPRLQMSEALML